MAYQAVNFDGTGSQVSDIAAYLGLAERTIRDRIKKMKGEFTLDKGRVYMTELTPDPDPEK